MAPREQRRDNPSVPVKFPDDVIDELEKIRESEKIAEFQMKARAFSPLEFCALFIRANPVAPGGNA